MQMVAADWLKSDKREDDLGGRPGGIVQVCALILTLYRYVVLLNYKYIFCTTIKCLWLKRKLTIFSSLEICSARWARILLHCKHTGKFMLP